MPNGYVGKILWVNLDNAGSSNANDIFREEAIPDKVYEQFLSGYGLASKIIFNNQKAGVDPLAPGNILCIMSGLLTNTPAFFNGRFIVAGKSPLTGTWGDSNCGGHFGPAIKQVGYDGIFFIGKSPKPVYLYIDNDDKQLLSAEDLWGKKDSNEPRDILTERHPHSQVACIGKGGENLSLIAGVVNDNGRLAGRGGHGAVMGSKNLKAICLKGDKKVPVADKERMAAVNKTYLAYFKKNKNTFINKLFGCIMASPLFSGIVRWLVKSGNLRQPEGFNQYLMQKWGTAGVTAFAANTGDSPVKNWMGIGSKDFPTSKARKISNNAITRYKTGSEGCAGCLVQCGAILKTKDVANTNKPEYETLCGFGTMLLSDNVENIILVNDMLNRAGIDTISCATMVAWAFEAYDKGVITDKDTEGLCLEWGNSEVVIALVQKIIDADGIGAILKDGLKRTVEHFKFTCERIAMEVGGMELPMHDSRQSGAGLSLGVGYETEPTPGRHTSTLDAAGYYQDTGAPVSDIPKPKKQPLKLHIGSQKPVFTDIDENEQNGEDQKKASCFMDIVNGLGLCAFGWNIVEQGKGGYGNVPPIFDWANGAAGWSKNLDDYMEIGRRIKTMRHAFNLREGIEPHMTRLPNRARGVPPQTKGINKYNVYDFDAVERAYYKAMGWDPDTSVPLEATLDNLDLPEVKAALYGK